MKSAPAIQRLLTSATFQSLQELLSKLAAPEVPSRPGPAASPAGHAAPTCCAATQPTRRGRRGRGGRTTRRCFVAARGAGAAAADVEAEADVEDGGAWTLGSNILGTPPFAIGRRLLGHVGLRAFFTYPCFPGSVYENFDIHLTMLS